MMAFFVRIPRGEVYSVLDAGSPRGGVKREKSLI